LLLLLLQSRYEQIMHLIPAHLQVITLCNVFSIRGRLGPFNSFPIKILTIEQHNWTQNEYMSRVMRRIKYFDLTISLVKK